MGGKRGILGGWLLTLMIIYLVVEIEGKRGDNQMIKVVNMSDNEPRKQKGHRAFGYDAQSNFDETSSDHRLSAATGDISSNTNDSRSKTVRKGDGIVGAWHRLRRWQKVLIIISAIIILCSLLGGMGALIRRGRTRRAMRKTNSTTTVNLTVNN